MYMYILFETSKVELLTLYFQNRKKKMQQQHTYTQLILKNPSFLALACLLRSLL